jgi:hypothetical protein
MAESNPPTIKAAAGNLQATNSLAELPRLKKLREDILASQYHVCTQKSSLLTEYFRRHVKAGFWERLLTPLHFALFRQGLEHSARGLPQKSWQVAFNNRLYALYLKGRGLSRGDYYRNYAGAFCFILESMELKVYDHELIVGNPSAQRVGAPIHPDLGGLLMLPEVRGINTRFNNPMGLEPVQLQELENKIFPYWFSKSVLALTPLYSSDPNLFNAMLEGRYFILTQFSGISHVTPDYPAVLEKGFNGIAGEIRAKLEEAKAELELSVAGGSDLC